MSTATGIEQTPERVPAHRFLVRSPNPLGDACMSLPAVRALKLSRPDAHITVACRENLAPLWGAREEVDEVIAFPRSYNPLQVAGLIRAARSFDAGLLLPNSFRSALELRLGGVRNLTGYRRHQRGILLKEAVREPIPGPGQAHQAFRYLHLAQIMGADLGSPEDWLLMPPAPMPISPDLEEIHLGVCPGAEYGNAKRYPVERYAAAIEAVRKNRPTTTIRVSIFGSPAERGIAAELAARLTAPCSNRAGETTISGLVEELQTCHLLVTNDTGTMHLAAALGVPTVAVFGSTEPALTAPIGEAHRIVRHPVDCSPCFLRECPIDYRCMLRIEAPVVSREMEALLDQSAQKS